MKTFDNLFGVIPALVSPLKEDHTLDEQALRKLVRHVIDGGVQGILALGTAGEGPLFSDEQRSKLMKIVKSEVAGKVPVIVGVDALGSSKAIEEVGKASAIGADYALVLPPFYMPIPENEIIEFYHEVSENSPIPVIMYNIPQLTKINISVGAVKKISQYENMAGVKDSGGDLTWFQNVQNACQSASFKVFQGRTTLWFVGAVLGADGIIDPAINIVPQWDLDIIKAVKTGDLSRAKDIQKKLLKLASAYSAPGYSVYLGVKLALAAMGIIPPSVMKPFTSLNSERQELILQTMKELAII